MKIDGGCQCGAVRYDAEIEPERVLVCHCRDCQLFSGAPFRVRVFCRLDDFDVTGEVTAYDKVAESGGVRTQHFCPRCGSHIYTTPKDNPQGIVTISAATARQAGTLKPRRQMWCRSRLEWFDGLADVPADETQPDLRRLT